MTLVELLGSRRAASAFRPPIRRNTGGNLIFLAQHAEHDDEALPAR
jgi:hypothetical protein